MESAVPSLLHSDCRLEQSDSSDVPFCQAKVRILCCIPESFCYGLRVHWNHNPYREPYLCRLIWFESYAQFQEDLSREKAKGPPLWKKYGYMQIKRKDSSARPWCIKFKL